MTIITNRTKKFYIWLKKRFAKPPYMGQSMYGYADFGDSSIFVKNTEYGNRVLGVRSYGDSVFLSGIYQVRTRYHHKTQVREKYYIPHNPRTIAQMAWRSSFSQAVLAWQNLTSNQKKVYNVKSRGEKKSGYNIFIGEYLKNLKL